MDSHVGDFIRTQIPDWDDDLIATEDSRHLAGRDPIGKRGFNFGEASS